MPIDGKEDVPVSDTCPAGRAAGNRMHPHSVDRDDDLGTDTEIDIVELIPKSVRIASDVRA